VGLWGIAVNRAGTFAYATNFASNTVSVIDAATNSVVATVSVGTQPIGVAVNPAGTLVYVANNTADTVSVTDTSTNTVAATVPVGSGPFGIAVNPAGTFVYVANFVSNTVSVIDSGTNVVVATVPVGTQPVAFGAFVGGGPSTNLSTLIETITSLDFQQGINLLLSAQEQIDSGNIGPACNKLSAFIDQVQAQSGKQLTTTMSLST
jgi:YVTN family beta-propeller protein